MDPVGLTIFKFYAPTLIASRGSDGKMRIEGIASSTIRDHHGDEITLKALRKMEQTAVGLTVFRNHKYDFPEDVFGRIEKAKVIKTDQIDPKSGQPIYDLRVGIEVADEVEQAVKSFMLIEKKQVNLGLSIGAMVPEGGATFSTDGGRYVVDDLNMVELSTVSLPANPRSFVDYAFKALYGNFPDTHKAELTRTALLKDLMGETTEDEEPVAKPEGIEAQLGDVVELHGDGTAKVLYKGGTPEAEKWVAENTDTILKEARPIDHLLKEAVDEEFDREHFLSGETGAPVDAEIAKTLAGLTMEQFVSGEGVVPELMNAEWSDEYVKDLPDKAFACPKQRAYPHHDQNGKVDPAQVRMALSKAECGKPHLEAHARSLGIGQKGAWADGTALAIQKADGNHQHPHAHVHSGEHTHGYGDSTTVHDHEHAHVHSHDHGSDHAHEDTFNDYSHSHYHSGPYDDEDHPHELAAGVTPDVTKTKVTVWEDDGGVIEVDTGRAKPKGGDVQSAQTKSETAGGLLSSPEGTGSELMVLQEAAKATIDNSGVTIKALLGQLAAKESMVKQLTEERDFAFTVAKQAFDSTQQILTKLGELPVGRKTGFVEIEKEFTDLRDVYDEDVVKLITKRSPQGAHVAGSGGAR